jgi:hypothetical protein
MSAQAGTRLETANAAADAEAAFKKDLREPCDIRTPEKNMLNSGES